MLLVTPFNLVSISLVQGYNSSASYAQIFGNKKEKVVLNNEENK